MENSKRDENDKAVDKEAITAKDKLDFYWKYFELQSNQRNQTCQLYFTLLTALLGGLFVVVKVNMHWASLVISITIVFYAVIFLFLFLRTTTLRDECRGYIAKLEDEYISVQQPGLFSSLENKPGENNMRTHTFFLILQFVFVVIVAVCGTIYSVCHLNVGK